MTIAVDFDGTIVEHRYPRIGKERPFAILTLKKLQAEHHQLILWTVREGTLLEEAVAFCRERGLEFYAVNANHPDEQAEECMTSPCRKVNADLFIDDCNVGGMPDWGVIYEMVRNKWSYAQYMSEVHSMGEPKKESFWKRILGAFSR